MSDVKKQQTLEIQLDEQVAQGSYCNRAIITHSASEFILDFGAMLPGISKLRVKNRIVLTPEHAKRLSMALEDNIKKYENQYGQIRVPDVKGYIPVSTFKGDA